MRPIVLDLNGFASFREPAQVDFTDVGFFALVGPTGSGKSTVIDAMTFALYGSVPRWGRKGMVSLALAPTVTRGTVKLVFDVDGRRYVVARELRRAGGQVSQKAASLERLTDPAGLAQPGEPTEVLARDLAAVTQAVEHLLGLSYEDFCQCVVLPQGQFANLLHAKPADRQEILLRLLGAEHYRQMMMRANQRAGNAGQRADALAETLTAFADATQDAQDAARAAEGTLTALKGQVEAAVPRIRAVAQELAAAEAELARLRQERAVLAGVQVPGDIAALDASLRSARSTAEQARAAERLAQDDDRAARAALAAGPRRGPLELARQRRADLAGEMARLPAAQADLTRLSAEAASADTKVRQAATETEELRARRDAASRHHADSQQQAHDLARDHAALATVTAPAGVDQLDERHRAAAAALRAAAAVLRAAEQADSDARAARGSAVASGPLEQSLRDLTDLGRAGSELAEARTSLDQARTARAGAQSALRAAEAASQQHQLGLDEARRANVVADLRPHLVPGHACPVCEQTVGTPPAPLDAPAIDAAQAALAEALAAVSAAKNKAGAAVTSEAAAAARLDSLAGQRARLVASLTAATAGPLASASLTALTALMDLEAGPVRQAGAGSAAGIGAAERTSQVTGAIAEIEDRIRQRQAVDEAADAAATAVESARAQARSAQAQADEAAAAVTTARSMLTAARDPLVALGAPPADDQSLAGAWTRFAGWAAAQARTRAGDLAAARAAEHAAAAELASVQAEFAAAETALSELRTRATTAARAEQEAQTRLAELTDRIEGLRELLRDAPEEKQVSEQLALLGGLEEAAAAAGGRLLAARSGRSDSERVLADLERTGSAARTRLSATRDPLVALGAPALDSEQAGLLAAWTELTAWAAGEAAAREKAGTAADLTVAEGRATLTRLTASLSAGLASAGLDVAPDAVAVTAIAEVVTALERARAATSRIAERRSQAADLRTRRDAEVDEQRVARMLGDLLRSDRFPRWLVTAAVDVLVAEASVILAGLSDGQYDLTHEDGEFYIIDHADADSRRSVRTLSGGETFQASLALALALSSQLTALAAAGAARLDSIFLDEGFGTLDPQTLEVVASTLESLAQGQRMVGIITHVPALAERVPVRYVVSRDARTSAVVREGFTAADAA